MLVYNSQGQIWIGRRRDAETWQLPQGGVEKGASLQENAVREVEEELGVARSDLGEARRLQATHRYDWVDPSQHFRGRYRGQEQTFWLIPFLGPDAAIRVKEVDHPEFSEWRWVEAEEVDAAVEEIRRSGYRGAVAEFVEMRQPS